MILGWPFLTMLSYRHHHLSTKNEVPPRTHHGMTLPVLVTGVSGILCGNHAGKTNRLYHGSPVEMFTSQCLPTPKTFRLHNLVLGAHVSAAAPNALTPSS